MHTNRALTAVTVAVSCPPKYQSMALVVNPDNGAVASTATDALTKPAPLVMSAVAVVCWPGEQRASWQGSAAPPEQAGPNAGGAAWRATIGAAVAAAVAGGRP